MTLLEGPDHYNGHCTCDRWSYRTADWTDLGTKWAWHYIAESERPDDHPLIPQDGEGRAGGHRQLRRGLPGCGHPVVKGRTYCRTCEAADEECGDNCERNCCWEDTVARRVARDAAHQTDPCPQLRQLPHLRRPGLPRPRGLHLSPRQALTWRWRRDGHRAQRRLA